LTESQATKPARRRRWLGALPGLVIALGLPLAIGLVAFLWDRQVINPEPNGPFIQTLQALAPLELLLGPVGILVFGLSAGLRNLISWLALILIAVPLLAFAWFVAVASLGGLAGEPF
jgi:hypothetical protein